MNDQSRMPPLPREPQPSLPDRLRQRRAMKRRGRFADEVFWVMTEEPDRLCRDAADEIERLQHELWELEIRFKMTPNSFGELPGLGEGWAVNWDLL